MLTIKSLRPTPNSVAPLLPAACETTPPHHLPLAGCPRTRNTARNGVHGKYKRPFFHTERCLTTPISLPIMSREVQQLLDAVNQAGIQDPSDLHWDLISKSVGGRTSKQCREKYKVSAGREDTRSEGKCNCMLCAMCKFESFIIHKAQGLPFGSLGCFFLDSAAHSISFDCWKILFRIASGVRVC